MRYDIENRTDLELIFTQFYNKAMNDDHIGHFFTEVIPIDLTEHLPHILDFWEMNLWGKKGYQKKSAARAPTYSRTISNYSSAFRSLGAVIKQGGGSKFRGYFCRKAKNKCAFYSYSYET